MTIESFLDDNGRASEWRGRVPRELVCDNLRSAGRLTGFRPPVLEELPAYPGARFEGGTSSLHDYCIDLEKTPCLRGFFQCAEEDSNLHGPYSPQGPQALARRPMARPSPRAG